MVSTPARTLPAMASKSSAQVMANAAEAEADIDIGDPDGISTSDKGENNEDFDMAMLSESEAEAGPEGDNLEEPKCSKEDPQCAICKQLSSQVLTISPAHTHVITLSTIMFHKPLARKQRRFCWTQA